MEKNIDDFIDEISTNFSELLVETFLIRFRNDFDKNKLLESAQSMCQITNKKIRKKLIKDLQNMGYLESDVRRYFK